MRLARLLAAALAAAPIPAIAQLRIPVQVTNTPLPVTIEGTPAVALAPGTTVSAVLARPAQQPFAISFSCANQSAVFQCEDHVALPEGKLLVVESVSASVIAIAEEAYPVLPSVRLSFIGDAATEGGSTFVVNVVPLTPWGNPGGGSLFATGYANVRMYLWGRVDAVVVGGQMKIPAPGQAPAMSAQVTLNGHLVDR
jgi:hypothetical protein